MKIKGLVILGLSAALALGTATVSALAAGWVEAGGQWQYQDDNGYKVTNAWRTGADGQWRYLNGSGNMAVSSWVDNDYYVDEYGVMIKDTWLKVDDINNNSDGVIWYYFGSNGKTVRDGWKKINDNWYNFDDMGQMQTGWADNNTYFLDANGQMSVGWKKLDPPEGTDYSQDWENEGDPFDLTENNGQYWYYFRGNGKKLTPKDDASAENGVVRIDGTYYCMNMDGALQYGWKNVTGNSGITAYKYFMPDGKMVTGWYSETPPKGLDYSDDEVRWYYFNSKGVPKADEDGEPTSKDLLILGGKTYLFNEYGNPVCGLRKVKVSESKDSYVSYYFGKNMNNCWAQKGRQQVEEGDGETSTFLFLDSGKGVHGVKDGSLYYYGKLQKAQEDKYELFNVPGKDYAVLINSSGKVMKNTTVKNSDGSKYKTNNTGIVLEIDGQTVGNLVGRDPVEPDWHEDDSWWH